MTVPAWAGKNAPASNTYTVSRAEQDVSGIRSPVSSRCARQGAGGGEGWQVAAKPDDQRQQRAPVKAKGAHRAVGDERGTCQVARVLQDTQSREHNRHDRQKREHRADADEQTVHQEPPHPGVTQAYESQHRRDSRGQGPVDKVADERLQRRRELGRELEQQPHHAQEMELRRLLPDLRRAVGDTRRVLVGFDRGGWSPALFEHMEAEGFDVLTWRKGPAENVDEPLFADAAYTDKQGAHISGGSRTPP
jgi:hypothetical protein